MKTIKKAIAVILTVLMAISMMPFTASAYNVVDDGVRDTIKATEDQEPLAKVYFQMPNGNNGPVTTSGEHTPSWYNDYNKAADGKHYPGMYWWDSPASPGEMPGYRMSIDDYDNSIFYAFYPGDGETTSALFNNGVDSATGKLAKTRAINMEGCYAYDEDYLYENTYNEFDYSGCIFVVDPNMSSTDSGTPTYGGLWYFYYGNGCYGNYRTDSSNYTSAEANCVNPDHFVDNVHVGYHEVPAPAEPTPSYADYVPAADDDADALAAKQVNFNGSKWLIIEDNSENDAVTLLANDTSFGNSAFSSSGTDYSTSTVKTELDSQTAVGGSFYDVADAIKSVDLTDVGVTNAKLYLLSQSEAEALPVNVRAFAFNNNLGGSWWLRNERTAGKSAGAVVGQDYSGKTAGTILGVTHGSTIGIRPALQLDLTAVDFDAETKTFSLKGEPAPGVAEIGGTQYESIQAAIEAASEDDTVKLLEDITLTETLVIAADKDFTLDLNGNDITGDVNDPLIINNGSLVVDDSSEAAGHIYNTNIEKQGNAAFVNNGTVNIKDGYFGDKNSVMDDNNAVNRGAGFENNGTAVIDGGYFTACDNYTMPEGGAAGYSYAIINTGDITINEATVYGKNNGNLANNGTMVVNGGTYNLNRKPGTPVFYTLYNGDANAETTVNGGTFTNSSNNKNSAMFYTDEGVMEIKGGSFNYVKALEASEGAPSISGGSFSSAIPKEYCAAGFAPVIAPDSETGMYTVGEPDNGASITVGETISENFYLDDDFYGETAYVSFTYNHNSDVSETADISTDIQAIASLDEATDGRKKFSVTQAPAQATEPVTINVYANAADAAAGENAVDTIDYSVYTYCRDIIENYTGEKAEEIKELAKSTLDYAAAAQTYFNYNTGDMATKDATGDFYNDVADFDMSTVSAPVSAAPSCIKRVSVVVKSDLEINLLSNAPLTVEGAGIAATKGTENFAVSTYQNGDYYVLHIAGIEAANMGKVITVETDKGDLVMTANSIIKMLAASGDTNLSTLAKAMYLYGTAASAYFE